MRPKSRRRRRKHRRNKYGGEAGAGDEGIEALHVSESSSSSSKHWSLRPVYPLLLYSISSTSSRNTDKQSQGTGHSTYSRYNPFKGRSSELVTTAVPNNQVVIGGEKHGSRKKNEASYMFSLSHGLFTTANNDPAPIPSSLYPPKKVSARVLKDITIALVTVQKPNSELNFQNVLCLQRKCSPNGLTGLTTSCVIVT